MSWFLERRMEWISESLRVFGYINREHLVKKFNISIPQATNDFHEFQRRFPGAMEYDWYVADARLVAAAPDLLEALKGVLQVADRKTVEFDAARAALAKARGAQMETVSNGANECQM